MLLTGAGNRLAGAGVARVACRHFDDHYLALLPPDQLPGLLGTVAGLLRGDLADVRAEPLRLRARVADLRVEAATEAGPPYRLRTLRLYPLETKVVDPRVAAPATRSSGAVPEGAAAVAAESFAELGLVGLIVPGPREALPWFDRAPAPSRVYGVSHPLPVAPRGAAWPASAPKRPMRRRGRVSPPARLRGEEDPWQV